MKWTGFGALACAAAMAIACNGTARDARDIDDADDRAAGRSVTADESTPAELRDGDTIGTAGQASGANMHGQTGDARYFVEHATMAGNAEVELGQLAGQRAQNPQVKEFAQMMVRDHSKAGAELKQAVSGHIETPDGLDAEHRQLKDRLSSLSGADFDREYMKAMVDGHKEVKSMLQDRTGSAHDPRAPKATGTTGSSSLDAAVNQWASKALPTVEQHLQRAEQIYGKVR
jgi:putative membrane protein